MRAVSIFLPFLRFALRVDCFTSNSRCIRECAASDSFRSKGDDAPADDSAPSRTTLTNWVVENLEDESSKVTSVSTSKAGEGDTLPETGLAIGDFRIFAAGVNDTRDDGRWPIRLLVGRNGWGTGVHPTTRLCLEWLSQRLQEGDTLLDYGVGSGVLTIAALHLGARRSIGVDVEAEALLTAERNVALNDFDCSRFEGLHTREVVPCSLSPGVNVCVANILVGQLVRPSMVAAIVSNMIDGGLVCFSGIRPNEVDSLKQAYAAESIEWVDEDYAQLSAADTEASLESYGFDCGCWARLVGQKCSSDNQSAIDRMSDLAVS